MFVMNLDVKIRVIKRELKMKYEIEVNKYKIYSTKKLALFILGEDHFSSHQMLHKYDNVLLMKNPCTIN